jgi:tetratricopeptide (TPR) repeat protein
VVVRARGLGQPETLAAALRVLAATQHENEAWAAELAALNEGILAAASAHDDRMIVDLWSKRLVALVWDAKPKEAFTLLSAAEAAIARITASLELRAEFVDAKALVLADSGKSADARAVLDPMIAELVKAGLTSQVIALRKTRGHTFGMEHDFPAAEAELRALVPQSEAAYGHDHPVVGDIHNQIGIMLNYQRKFTETLTELHEALRILEARLEESPALAHLIYAIGTTHMQMDEVEKARPYIERSVAMARRTLPPDDVRLADYVGLQATLGEYKESRAGFLEAIAIREKGPRPHIVIANYLHNVAVLEQEQKHHEDSIAFNARALAEYEAITNPDHDRIAIALWSTAKSQIALKRYPEALASCERALKGVKHPMIREQVRYWHGQARIKSGDRGGAAEVKEASAALQLTPGQEP